MQRLADPGIRAGVLMAPLLPGLSAEPDSIARMVRAAAGHGARFVGTGVLHLDYGIRAYFFDFLRRAYPQLLDSCERLFPGKDAPHSFNGRVEHAVSEAKAAAGYGSSYHRSVETIPAARQLALL